VTPEANRGAIDSELAIAEAEFEVHQYQFAAANRALTAAGGNLPAQIEALVEQHRTAGATSVELPEVTHSPTGLVALAGRAWDLRGKRNALDAARDDVLDAHRRLSEQRATLAAEFSDAPESAGSTAAERLASARERAMRRQRVAAYDERVAAHGELVQVYDEWLVVARRQAEFVQHRMLRGLALIAGIGLALLLLGRAIGRALARLQLDRRQAEALRTVVTVALQVVGVLLIVFVLFGPPTQLGTVLGLATAGLTVALKDFIVAFFGWFVLMGRNGIRLGDWVEIRGVAGEVVELSVFHTVLLETGNWTDTGHPTGRRVTFTNSYAIEGHYFNFSTSGQWLWDTLSVVVPNGGDLYGFVGTLTDTAKALTEQSAREAEAEWQRAARTRKLTGLSAEPAVRLKPVVGGTEVSVRYITRADERYRLRSELYAVAVQRLGVTPVPG
jgi:small-conductance mechanosensitive channel